MNKAIGGYHELELWKGEHFHKKALRLNTARNCFEYVLRARGYRKVYIPYYTCEVMLEPINKLGISYEFYNINEDFEPIQNIQLCDREAFLYTNYFGIKQLCVEKLAQIYGNRLIIDNAQAFFAKPLDGIDTFYSCRKFFGVPDGAYLYTDCFLATRFEQDHSYTRISHLLKRIDLSAEDGYKDFQQAEDLLCNQSILTMSKFTELLLSSINYSNIAHKRRANYEILRKSLGGKELLDDDVPMVFPYLANDGQSLRKNLIQNKIFVAKYWPNVEEWVGENALETWMANNILPLPIDQRYGVEDMQRIINTILG